MDEEIKNPRPPKRIVIKPSAILPQSIAPPKASQVSIKAFLTPKKWKKNNTGLGSYLSTYIKKSGKIIVSKVTDFFDQMIVKDLLWRNCDKYSM